MNSLNCFRASTLSLSYQIFQNTPKGLGQLQVDTDDISKSLVVNKIIKRVCRSYNIDRENERLTGYAIYKHMNNPLGTTTIQILLVSCRKQISAKLRTADIFTYYKIL